MGDENQQHDNLAYRSALLLREALATAHITAEVDIRPRGYRREIRITVDLNNADHLAHLLDNTDAH